MLNTCIIIDSQQPELCKKTILLCTRLACAFLPLDFQSRKNDSNRLANRGGALLKEEKIRKGINKELPKVTLISYDSL